MNCCVDFMGEPLWGKRDEMDTGYRGKGGISIEDIIIHPCRSDFFFLNDNPGAFKYPM